MSIDLEAAAAALEASENYRVLRRFRRRERYTEEPWNLGEPTALRLGVFTDVETNSLDDDSEIIEFAAVPFTFDAKTGVVYEVRMSEHVWGFEEPRGEISDEVQRVHGITPAMVKGHRLDDARIKALVMSADIAIAHKAHFDRPIMERRLPVFENVHWACSLDDIVWEKYGCRNPRLESLLAET